MLTRMAYIPQCYPFVDNINNVVGGALFFLTRFNQEQVANLVGTSRSSRLTHIAVLIALPNEAPFQKLAIWVGGFAPLK